MDPNNPRILYAGFWQVYRKPWTLESGGPEGGIWQTTDGGDTWKKLAGGLPEGTVGNIGVAVSPARPERVWAIVEAKEKGGVFRSDDGGEKWTRVNSENKLRQRAWYYTKIYADPKNAESVYVLNTGFFRSQRRRQDLRSDPRPARRQPRPLDRPGRPGPHDRVATTAARTSPSTAAGAGPR